MGFVAPGKALFFVCGQIQPGVLIEIDFSAYFLYGGGNAGWGLREFTYRIRLHTRGHSVQYLTPMWNILQRRMDRVRTLQFRSSVGRMDCVGAQ